MERSIVAEISTFVENLIDTHSKEVQITHSTENFKKWTDEYV